MVILGHQNIQLAQNAAFAAITALYGFEHVSDGLPSAVLVELVVSVLQLGHGDLSFDVDSAMGVCLVCPHSEVDLLFGDDLAFHIKGGLAVGYGTLCEVKLKLLLSLLGWRVQLGYLGWKNDSITILGRGLLD